MADTDYQRLRCGRCATAFNPTLRRDGKPHGTQPLTCSRSCRERLYKTGNGRGTRPEATTPGACRQCGNSFEPKIKAQLFCAVRCKEAFYNPKRDRKIPGAEAVRVARQHAKQASRLRVAESKVAAAAAAWWKQEQRQLRLTGKTCCICQSAMDADRATCSKLCAQEYGLRQKRARRVARKAVERAASSEVVDPIAVFQRDGWQCYLCGCDTPAVKRGSYDDDAPELEHVVALSKGGEHSYRNCRCACRACNIIKGDRDLAEVGGAYMHGGGGCVEANAEATS